MKPPTSFVVAIAFGLGIIIASVGCDDPNSKGTDESNDIDSLEMVFVEGGTFTRGKVSVTVSDFFISRYEVTQGLWQSVMGANPSHFTGNNNFPVELVSWHDANAFIEKLNLQTQEQYRLPTEAEWEFAARGGNGGKGYDYAGGSDINSVAWYIGNSDYRTHVVGLKAQNELGIYDMSGNVWEWVSDWYGDYDSVNMVDPVGPDSGSVRVSRGCGWNTGWTNCGVSHRHSVDPGSRSNNQGFRLVLSAQ